MEAYLRLNINGFKPFFILKSILQRRTKYVNYTHKQPVQMLKLHYLNKNGYNKPKLKKGLYLCAIGIVKASSEFDPEPEEEPVKQQDLNIIELNEISSLTHQTLLRQAGRATVDASITLVHRAARAFLDIAEIYRLQLNEAIDNFEWSIDAASGGDGGQLGIVLDVMLPLRSQLNINKKLLEDLNMLLDYACKTLDNASLAAYLGGAEFCGDTAQQVIKQTDDKIRIMKQTLKVLEDTYLKAQADHIIATKKRTDKLEEEREIEATKEKETEADTEVQTITNENRLEIKTGEEENQLNSESNR